MPRCPFLSPTRTFILDVSFKGPLWGGMFENGYDPPKPEIEAPGAETPAADPAANALNPYHYLKHSQ